MGWKWRAYFGLVALVEVGLLSGAAWLHSRPKSEPPVFELKTAPMPVSNDHTRRDAELQLMIDRLHRAQPSPSQPLGDYGTQRR